jgi:hypothetical protein
MNFNPMNKLRNFFNRNEVSKNTYENNQEASPEQVESFKKQMSRLARKGMFYLMFTSPLMGFASGPGSSLTTKETKKSKSDTSIDVDFTGRDHLRDSKGNVTENDILSQIVFPGQGEFGYETKYVNKIDQVIPYSWSRNFSDAKAQTPAERDSIREHIIQDLQKDLEKKFVAWGFFDHGKTTAEVYNYKHGVNNTPYSEKTKPVVDSITITGLASPEGSKISSFFPGNVDAKNVSLAEKRAHDLEPYIKEALKRMGVDTNTIKSIKAEEVQFSPTEIKNLVDLATKGGYNPAKVGVATAVQMMIKDYNRGFIKDAATIKQLDNIIATKRGVKVEINYHGTESTKHVVPIPWLILLMGLGGLALRKFLKKETPDKPTPPGGPFPPEPPIGPEPEPKAKAPRQIFSEATFRAEDLDQKKDRNFHDIYRSALETEGATPKDREIIYETVFAEEIYDFMDDEATIANGLDYKKIVDFARAWRAERPGYADEVKEKIADEILTQWQNYDRKIREGIKTVDGKPLPVETTVEYRHDPKKVLWAIEAAIHIYELAGTKTNEELLALMDKKVDEIEQRRHDRGNTTNRKNTLIVEKPVPEPVIDGPFVGPKKAPSKKAVAALSKTTVETPKKVATTPGYEPIFGSEEMDDILRDYANGKAPDNVPVEPAKPEKKVQPIGLQRYNLQRKIDSIDKNLRTLEAQLESSLRKDEKIPLEQKFNELEQEKRGIENQLNALK